MVDTFKAYHGNEVVAEGQSPLEIKGIGPNKEVNEGEYHVVRVSDGKESEKVSVPAFKTLPITVTSVKLNKTTLSLEIGADETLTAIVEPSDAADKSVQYSSSDETVAIVSSDQGKVTGVKAGTAAITAKTANGKTATCEVTVTEPNEG